jgi:hypothetical protein
MESIELRTLAGADNITVGELAGIDVTEVNVDLRGPNGGTDGAVDNVTVNATDGADVIGVSDDTGMCRACTPTSRCSSPTPTTG